MKLTKQQLKQLIKEELETVLNEARDPAKLKAGTLSYKRLLIISQEKYANETNQTTAQTSHTRGATKNNAGAGRLPDSCAGARDGGLR